MLSIVESFWLHYSPGMFWGYDETGRYFLGYAKFFVLVFSWVLSHY